MKDKFIEIDQILTKVLDREELSAWSIDLLNDAINICMKTIAIYEENE